MKHIIGQVESLFYDEKIKELIELYILLNGEFKEVYRKIYDSDYGEVDADIELILDMIPKAITKHILDNVVDFIEYCNDREVKIINDIRKVFAKEVEFASMKIEKLSEDSDERTEYEKYKASYEQNINLGQVGYGIHVVLVKELINTLREYMNENLQKALTEIIVNFKVACQMHGIVEQKVEETKESMGKQEETLAELQQKLEKLRKQEKRTTQKREETRLLRNAYQSELKRRQTQLIN